MTTAPKLEQAEATTSRETHFYLAGWNGAVLNLDATAHFQKAQASAPQQARSQNEAPAVGEQDVHSFPAMTPELASILGLMCFQCIPFAQALRAAGNKINTRAEDEQAAVLHWMIGHWFRHGEEWRDHAQADMDRMKAAAIASQAAQQGGAA